MTELRFDEGLYDGFAIDEAAKAFEPFAVIERERAGGAFVLRVALTPAPDAPSEEDVAAELCNYALAKTIERRGATS